MFPALKLHLGVHKLKDDREVDTVETRWLITQDTGFCQQGREKLIPGYDKCFGCRGGCVKNWWDSSIMNQEEFFLELKVKSPI